MSQRDQIARIQQAVFDGVMGHYAMDESDNDDQVEMSALVADIMERVRPVAAGLIVPEGMTAEKLRAIATTIERLWQGPIVADGAVADMLAALRAWADFLDTQETPR